LAIALALALAGCGPADGESGASGQRVTGVIDAASSTPAPAANTTPATATPPSALPATTAAPESRTVTETQPIPFTRRTVEDPALPQGGRTVRTPGVAGERTLTYEVSYANGVEVGRKLIGDKVTRQPVTEVVAVGTKPASKCDPNYSGCVPIASDVDCAGGSGNGPAYVRGPVRVIGTDIYDLDRDGDGIACE
jgi:hypothetical protein